MTVLSPKATAFPVVAISIDEIELCFVGVAPPAKIPIIELLAPPRNAVVAVKSPKSVAFPADAIVTKSI